MIAVNDSRDSLICFVAEGTDDSGLHRSVPLGVPLPQMNVAPYMGYYPPQAYMPMGGGDLAAGMQLPQHIYGGNPVPTEMAEGTLNESSSETSGPKKRNTSQWALEKRRFVNISFLDSV